MDIPAFLGPVRTVAEQAVAAGLDLRAEASATANPLDISVEPQALSNWCWAAVTSAIELFYGESYAAEQCVVATRFLFIECCPPGEDSPDNPRNSTYDLVTALGRNAATGAVDGQLSFDDLRREILDGRPVCCVMKWSNGDLHVVLASGYTTGGDVWIEDPAAPGPRSRPWDAFCRLYAGEGHWKQTIKTKRSTA